MKPTSHVLAGSLLVTSLVAQGPLDRGPQRDDVPPLSRIRAQAEGPVLGHRLPSLRTPIHTAAPDHGIEYGIWAAGDSYKASFHGGMTFVPYLGAGYPITQPVHWQTSSARLGTHELLENPGAVPVQDQWRYEYRFGAFTEAYDVRSEGLEQTFVLHQRPASGDLVIRGVVTSLLHAKNVAAAHQALVFADDQGNKIVEYGAASAFDARGDRVLVDTSYTDGVVTLTVPGAWLERATLPVTVDPLLARVLITYWVGPFGQVEDVDIARNDHLIVNNVMITQTRSASAADSDLYAQLVNDDFSESFSPNFVYSDITTSWTTDQPSCAYVGGTDRWALVFRRHFTSFTVHTSELRCHVRNGSNLSLLTGYGVLNPPAGRNDWRPDVGGVRAEALGNEALVVFQREDNSATGGDFANTDLSDVRGCLLDTTTLNGTFGAVFGIKPNALYDNERPSVNQVAEGGANFSWVCVFQRFLDGATNEDWDLIGARIAQDGTVAPGTWTSDLENATPSQHQIGPVVEGTAGRYAVAFTTVGVAVVNLKTLSIAGKKVQVERFDWADGANAPDGDRAPVELFSASDRRYEATGIGYDTHDRSHWALAVREIPPGVPSMYCVRVGFSGGMTESAIASAGFQPSRGACVFDNDNRKFLFAYGVDLPGPPSLPVYGHTLVYDVPAASATFGTSCSTAALSWNGNQQIGAEFNNVEVSGAPASAIHIMLLSLATDNLPVIHPIVASGCRLYVDLGPGYLGSFPTAFGANPSWQLPLPEFLTSQNLFFQDWYLDATVLLYSTERLKVPIIR